MSPYQKAPTMNPSYSPVPLRTSRSIFEYASA